MMKQQHLDHTGGPCIRKDSWTSLTKLEQPLIPQRNRSNAMSATGVSDERVIRKDTNAPQRGRNQSVSSAGQSSAHDAGAGSGVVED